MNLSPERSEFQNLNTVPLFQYKDPELKMYITPIEIKKEEEKRLLQKKRYLQAKKNINERKSRVKADDSALNDIKGMAKLSRDERKTMMYIKQIEEMEKVEHRKNNPGDKYGDGNSLTKKNFAGLSDDDPLDNESLPSKKLKADKTNTVNKTVSDLTNPINFDPLDHFGYVSKNNGVSKGIGKYQNIHLNKNYNIKPCTSLVEYMASYQDRELRKIRQSRTNKELILNLIDKFCTNKPEKNDAIQNELTKKASNKTNPSSIFKINLETEEVSYPENNISNFDKVENSDKSSQQNGINHHTTNNYARRSNGFGKDSDTNDIEIIDNSSSSQDNRSMPQDTNSNPYENSKKELDMSSVNHICDKMKDMDQNNVNNAFKEITKLNLTDYLN